MQFSVAMDDFLRYCAVERRHSHHTVQAYTADLTDFRKWLRLMVSTGFRVGELCKLRINDVAPDGSSLRIHGKDSRDRIAYITDAALRQELQQHAAQAARAHRDLEERRTSGASILVP